MVLIPVKKEIKNKEIFNKNGDYILIASPIHNKGVDIPIVNSLIIDASRKSEVRTIQQAGRGFRKKEYGIKLLVYDFQDSGKFLDEHRAKRIGIYSKGFNHEEN